MQEPFIMALGKGDDKNERLYGQTITSPTWGTSPKRVTSPTRGPPDLHVNRPLDPVTNYMAGAFI